MKVLVIDNYDSFVYNIVQYLGELGATPVVYRNDIPIKRVEQISPERVVLSPGPGTPEDGRDFGCCLSILHGMSRHTPTLGVCLGHQGIVYAFGGEIRHAHKIMHGKTSMIKHDGEGFFKGVQNPFEAARYHSLVAKSSTIPSCLRITATSLDDQEVMGVRHTEYPIIGVQFHPESILTGDGKRMLKNFLDGVE